MKQLVNKLRLCKSRVCSSNGRQYWQAGNCAAAHVFCSRSGDAVWVLLLHSRGCRCLNLLHLQPARLPAMWTRWASWSKAHALHGSRGGATQQQTLQRSPQAGRVLGKRRGGLCVACIWRCACMLHLAGDLGQGQVFQVLCVGRQLVGRQSVPQARKRERALRQPTAGARQSS